MKAYKLKITLLDVNAPVWRIIVVPADITFKRLHDTIQLAMGWYDCHLHEFKLDDLKVRITNDDQAYEEYRYYSSAEGKERLSKMKGDPFVPDMSVAMRRSDNTKIDKYLEQCRSLIYTYDFGDSWRHHIEVLSKTEDYKNGYPEVLVAEGNCPPEDCGGVSGYEDFLLIWNNQDHPEHEEMREWGEGQGYGEYKIKRTNLLMHEHLKLKKVQSDNQGVSYTFKVELNKTTWRKIRIAESATLDKLHQAIFGAFQFSDDHLYAFFMDNKAWSERGESYWSPYNDEGPYADKVKIRELGLTPKRKFLYLFDFGDEWRFTVTVDSITEGTVSKPVVIEQKGDSPEQYPDYDDWDEFDDTDEYFDEEEVVELEWKHLTIKEYIKLNGYPLNGIDFFLIDMLNLSACAIKETFDLANAKLKTAVTKAFPKIKQFYLSCITCQYDCYGKMKDKLNIKNACEKNNIPCDTIPERLLEDEKINFIYIEMVACISSCLFDELRMVAGKAKAEEMTGLAQTAMFDYIAFQCRGNCQDACIVQHDKNAYCQFCMNADGELPCPKNDEKLYNATKTTPEDMIHE